MLRKTVRSVSLKPLVSLNLCVCKEMLSDFTRRYFISSNDSRRSTIYSATNVCLVVVFAHCIGKIDKSLWHATKMPVDVIKR